MRLEEWRWCDKLGEDVQHFLVSHYMLGSMVAGAHHLTSTQSIAPSQGRSLSGLKAQLDGNQFNASEWMTISIVLLFCFFVFFIFRKRTSHGANEDEPLKYLCFTTCFEYIRTYHIYIYLFMSCIKIASLDVPFWAPWITWNHFGECPKTTCFLQLPGVWWIEAVEALRSLRVAPNFLWSLDVNQDNSLSYPFIPMVCFIPIHCSNVWAAVLFLQVMSSPDALNGRPVAAAVPLREPLLSWWF